MPARDTRGNPFFAREVLPRIGADRRIIESTDLDLMELPEEAF